MRPPIAPTGPASSPWGVLLAATWTPSLEARLQVVYREEGASIHLAGQTWQILLYLGSRFWSWRQRSRQANSPQPESNLRPANVPDFLPSTTQGSIILTTRQKRRAGQKTSEHSQKRPTEMFWGQCQQSTWPILWGICPEQPYRARQGTGTHW